jgi:hypothetical protein
MGLLYHHVEIFLIKKGGEPRLSRKFYFLLHHSWHAAHAATGHSAAWH